MGWVVSQPLTDQQEHFARLVGNGSKLAPAYREAYPSSLKWKDETVWSNASRLARNGKVKARIDELRADAIGPLAVDYQERLNTYADLALRAIEADDIGAAIRAQDSLTKVAGLFSADRANDRSPIDGLNAAQRDKIREKVDRVLARVSQDASSVDA